MSQRFSDAELAAEYWAAYSEHVRNSAQIIYEKGAMDNPHVQASFSTGIVRATTLHRFATLPHAHPENLVNANTKENT